MSQTVIQTVTNIGAIGASVSADVAGLFRFRAWWQDRARQRRIDAAMHFKDNGTASWQKAWGVQLIDRENFAALTGINRDSGHEALRRCQQRLGGTDHAWRQLRGVGRYLIASGHVARVRKPQRRDHIRATFGFVFSLFLTSASLLLAAIAVATATTANWDALSAKPISVNVTATIYASLFAFGGLLVGQHCGKHTNAWALYRELVKIGRARRAQQARARKTSPSEWQLVEEEASLPAVSTKPHLVDARRQKG